MSARAGEKAALKVIGLVLDAGAFFNIALDEVLAGNVDEKDRAAASAVARDVIENVAALDYALGKVTDLSRCKKPIRNILRIGASRILYTDMKQAAAVSSAVDICRAIGKGAQAGYVNAVLRSLAKADVEWPSYTADPVQHLAIKYSWPEWYCREIIDGFGQEFAYDYLSYRGRQEVTLRINPRKATREQVIGDINGKPYAIDDGCVISGKSNVAAHPAYKAGKFSIQGAGSMIAARQALTDGLVIDVCAAPGGKSGYIAERMAGRVVACDIHPHRVKLIEAQMKRLGLENVEVHERDARLPMEEFIGKADCVLVDAPCTGLGTALNRPDVKLNKSREDAAALAALQLDILKAASLMVRPGGRLVYCTCTPTPMETDQVISEFTRANAGFSLDELDLPDGIRSESKGIARLWPHIHGTDAFYICRMVKSETL